MEALNFLYEKPTTSWLDIYLNPEKLEEKFADTPTCSTDFSIETLVQQLCDQAKLEESYLAKDILPCDERDYHKNKCQKLWIIVLKICAYLKWNLKAMRKHISLVNLKHLVEELCAVTWNTNSLAYVLTSTQNLQELSTALRFVVFFTARWLLTFLISYMDNSREDKVLDSVVYNSFPQPPAKITVSNPILQVDPSHVLAEAKNYCLTTTKCVEDLAVQMLESALKLANIDYRVLSPKSFDIPIEGHGDLSLNWDCQEETSQELAILQIKYDLAVYYFMVCNYDKAKVYFEECTPLFDIVIPANSHWTFNVDDLRGYFQALDIPLHELSEIQSPDPSSDAMDFSFTVERFGQSRDLNLKRYTPEYSVCSKLDGIFPMLKSFDVQELKHMVSKNHCRVSVHYCVPPAVQSCVGRLPSGNVQDLVALYVCKANQIAQFTGTSNVSSSFLQAAIQEYRQISKDIPFDIINEHLRLELTNWHDSLHKSTDEARMGQLTSELAAKVKSFIGEYDRTNLPMPSHEMSMLTSAFLLNTCDWDYVIYNVSKNFRSRYMDFSKFISALIINSCTNKAGQVAKEVLEILLPLCYDPSPRQMLLSRQQFLLIITMIKEQTAIAMLLSFFGNLFNFKQGGLMDIFVENTSIWPNHHVDSGGINENFLKEVLDVILTNGLLINPNNASLLRTMADLKLGAEQYASAMQYYMQSYAMVTDFFTKSSVVSSIVDDKMIDNMIKCCSRLNFHTIEAMLAQLSDKPNYRAAVKALQEPVTLDGGDTWYPMIWDIALLETFISNSYPNNDCALQARLDEAFRLIGQQELNCHNSLDVLNAMEHRRKFNFLSAVCAVFFD